VKVISNSAFTDDVLIFNRYTLEQTWRLKGTLYKVTCYLAGSIVATYDFENTQSQVGTTVLDLPFTNLIPSFDDARWSLHANTQVLGKDYLRLNATGFDQASKIVLDVKPNTTYLMAINGSSNGRLRVGVEDGTNPVNGIPWGTLITSVSGGGQLTFTTGVTVTKINALVTQAVASSSGTFDFIQPKLFQLDGKEGTLNGSPTPRLKRAKRILYNKR
jgi:hypothetical protein